MDAAANAGNFAPVPAARPEQNTRLLRACISDSADAARAALDAGADPKAQDIDQRSALHLAASKGSHRVCQALLDHGCTALDRCTTTREQRGWSAALVALKAETFKVLRVLTDSIPDEAIGSVSDGLGVTGLMFLAVCEDVGRIERLSREGLLGDLNAQDQNHETALFKAVAAGRVESVRLLMRLSDAPLKATHRNITPLMQACVRGSWPMARMLLDSPHRGPLDDTDASNETALLKACWKGHSELARMLLDAGADPAISAGNGWSPLAFAARHSHTEVVRLLLASRRDVRLNEAADDGETPLFKALGGGDEEATRMLLAAGADPACKNRAGITALMQAAFKGSIKAVTLLLETGKTGEIDAKDRDHETALLKACWQGHADVVRMLLSRGADPSVPTKKGWTPLMFAARDGHAEVVRQLLDTTAADSIDAVTKDDHSTALVLAAVSGRTACVRMLLDKGASAVIAQARGFTPMALASYAGHCSTVDALLRSGKAGPINHRDPDGETALLKACWKGHADVVRMLLSNGADPSVRTAVGISGLMFAARDGHTHAIRALLESDRDCDIDAQDDEGRTALMRAADQGWIHCVRLLVAAGADILLTTSSGSTAFDVASMSGKADVAGMLEPLERAERRWRRRRRLVLFMEGL